MSPRFDRAGASGHPDPLPMWLLGVLGTAGFLLTWELLPRLGVVDRNYLPPFTEVVRSLVQQLGTAPFWSGFGQTLLGWAGGLSIALVLGTALGTLIGAVPHLVEITHSTIEFLRPIPSVAIIPLCLLVLGSRPTSTLVIVVWAGFWPILVQLLHGIRDVDPVARDTASSYRLGPLTRVRTLTWPTALPYLMTGVRLSASITLVLETTGELIMGTPGLGSILNRAQAAGDRPQAFALVLLLGLVAVTVNLAVRAVERRALSWHPSHRVEVA